MEVCCLRHPGDPTIGSRLQWWANGGQILKTQPYEPHAARGTGTHHTVKTVERGRERGWEWNCLGD